MCGAATWKQWLTVGPQDSPETCPGRLAEGGAGLRMQSTFGQVPGEQSSQACWRVVAPKADSNVSIVQSQEWQTDLNESFYEQVLNFNIR